MTAGTSTLSQERPLKPRRVGVAVALAALSPPTAYLYVGRPWRALALAIAALAFAWGMHDGLGGRLAQPAALLAFGVVELGLWLFAIVDAGRIAARERAYRLRGYNSYWIYLIVYLAVVVGFNALDNSAFGGSLAVRSFSIPSRSMQPTLDVGDYAIGDMRAFERAAPAPGDVVLIARNGATYVKRIVAGPGDAVEIAHGVLSVNDAAVRLDAVGLDNPPQRAVETLANGVSHLILPNPEDAPGADMAKLTAPAGAYFVLGDNRGNSMDSRYPEFGWVPRAEIIGRMSFIAWSRDRRRIGAGIP